MSLLLKKLLFWSMCVYIFFFEDIIILCCLQQYQFSTNSIRSSCINVFSFLCFSSDIVHKFVRDNYSKKFPELDSLVPTAFEYLKTVKVSITCVQLYLIQVSLCSGMIKSLCSDTVKNTPNHPSPPPSHSARCSRVVPKKLRFIKSKHILFQTLLRKRTLSM